MFLLLAVVVACVAGLLSLGLALCLIPREETNWLTWVRSLRGGSVLCLGLAGLLLSTGGLYKLIRILHTPAEQAERWSRFQVAMQEPLDQLLVSVAGADPFDDREVRLTVRFRVRLKSGREMISDVPQDRFHPIDGMESCYRLLWSEVVEAVPTLEGRALAERFQTVGTFQRVDRFALELLQRGNNQGLVPDAVVIGVNDQLNPPLFSSDTAGLVPTRVWAGKTGSEPPARLLGAAFLGTPLAVASALTARRGTDQFHWVTACDDEHSPATRIKSFWLWELTPPHQEFGLLFGLTTLGGGTLVLLGVGILSQRSRTSPS